MCAWNGNRNHLEIACSVFFWPSLWALSLMCRRSVTISFMSLPPPITLQHVPDHETCIQETINHTKFHQKRINRDGAKFVANGSANPRNPRFVTSIGRISRRDRTESKTARPISERERRWEWEGEQAGKTPVELVVGVVHAAALAPSLVGEERRVGGILGHRTPLAAARLRLRLRLPRRRHRWCPGPRTPPRARLRVLGLAAFLGWCGRDGVWFRGFWNGCGLVDLGRLGHPSTQICSGPAQFLVSFSSL